MLFRSRRLGVVSRLYCSCPEHLPGMGQREIYQAPFFPLSVIQASCALSVCSCIADSPPLSWHSSVPFLSSSVRAVVDPRELTGTFRFAIALPYALSVHAIVRRQTSAAESLPIECKSACAAFVDGVAVRPNSEDSNYFTDTCPFPGKIGRAHV